MARKLGNAPASTAIEKLKQETFFRREKENLVFPIALANLVLHGIDQPNPWHGNTLTGRATYAALFDHAPRPVRCDPHQPAVRRQGRQGCTKELCLRDWCHPGAVCAGHPGRAGVGTCAIVLDEGLLFRTNESAFVETKRKLLDECELWAIVSLPGGVFSTAGAGVKTNLLFFTKGKKTKRIWSYDLSG